MFLSNRVLTRVQFRRSVHFASIVPSLPYSFGSLCDICCYFQPDSRASASVLSFPFLIRPGWVCSACEYLVRRAMEQNRRISLQREFM